MMRFFGRLLSWLGGLVILAGLALLLFVTVVSRSKEVPARTILEVDLETDVVEDRPDDPLGQLSGMSKHDLRSMLQALERAQLPA